MSETRKLSLGMKDIIEVLKEEEKKSGKLPPKVLLDFAAYPKLLKSDNGHILGGDNTQFFLKSDKGEVIATIIVRMYGSTYRLSSVKAKGFVYAESEKYSPVILVITG